MTYISDPSTFLLLATLAAWAVSIRYKESHINKEQPNDFFVLIQGIFWKKEHISSPRPWSILPCSFYYLLVEIFVAVFRSGLFALAFLVALVFLPKLKNYSSDLAEILCVKILSQIPDCTQNLSEIGWTIPEIWQENQTGVDQTRPHQTRPDRIDQTKKRPQKFPPLSNVYR